MWKKLALAAVLLAAAAACSNTPSYVDAGPLVDAHPRADGPDADPSQNACNPPCYYPSVCLHGSCT